MDEIYRNIYSQLYDSVQPDSEEKTALWHYAQNIQPGAELDAGRLRQMIDAAERETLGGPTNDLIIGPYDGRRLRPDAKLFLLINFLQMIVHPVSLAGRRNQSDLRRILFADTVSLLKEAAGETRDRDVSSHAVLKALTKNWMKLNLSALKLWED